LTLRVRTVSLDKETRAWPAWPLLNDRIIGIPEGGHTALVARWQRDRTAGPDTARLAKECADEALTLLQHAVARGYKNAAQMKQDQDLAALRQRADFQKLLAELELERKK